MILLIDDALPLHRFCQMLDWCNIVVSQGHVPSLDTRRQAIGQASGKL